MKATAYFYDKETNVFKGEERKEEPRVGRATVGNAGKTRREEGERQRPS
jgi:hypothetical protein